MRAYSGRHRRHLAGRLRTATLHAKEETVVMAARTRLDQMALLLLLLLAAWTPGAGAATADDDASVRVVTLGPGPPSCPWVPPGVAFAKGITDAGHDLRIWSAARCYSEVGDLPGLVAELMDTHPTLLVVWGSVVAVRAVRQAAPALPIVFIDVPDPVEAGLVDSLSHPGGNMTGTSNITTDLLAKRVQILRDALPQARRLAVLCNLSNPQQAEYLRTAMAAARAAGFEARAYSVGSPEQLDGAFDAMGRDGMDALVLLPDAWFYPNRQRLFALVDRSRIPMIAGNTEYTALGALFTYGVDLVDMSYRAARYVDRIVKGARPADLPVELPTQYNFVVNAAKARSLGLTIPPSVLLRATKVIE
jgi:putative tryptophan/tyrosine transport system substrate-binding protein